jgi:glycerate dehydrogenase
VALAFGMKVIAYTRTPKVVEGVELVSEKQLFSQSDFVSFHCPLNKDSERVLNRETIELMKPTAFVINTARGGVIDEQALADALRSRRIAGAGLDVLTSEPMAADCPLADIENCIITPHIAWAAYESRVRLIDIVVDNLRSFAAGTPINVVNK